MTNFLIETPCTSEAPRVPDTRIPVWKVNSYEATSLDEALVQARQFWETNGYYVIGDSRQTQNNPPPKSR